MGAGLVGADGLLPSTYLSVKADWSFGLAYINGFNLVRCLSHACPTCFAAHWADMQASTLCSASLAPQDSKSTP